MEDQQNTAIYARVSTRDQSHDSQVEKCLNFVDQRDNLVVEDTSADVYTDIQTGKDDDRPGYTDLCQSIEQGEYDAFVATEFSRISRNDDEIKRFIADLMERDLSVYLIDEGFASETGEDDITRKAKQMVADILAGIATMELLQKDERRTRGIQHAREEEGKWTRKPPLGFYVKNGQLRVERDEFIQVREALLERRRENTSWADLAEPLGVDRTTLSKIYRDEEKRRLYLYGEGYDEWNRIETAIQRDNLDLYLRRTTGQPLDASDTAYTGVMMELMESAGEDGMEITEDELLARVEEKQSTLDAHAGDSE